MFGEPKVTEKKSTTKEYTDLLGDEQKKSEETTTVKSKETKTGKV